MTESTSTTHELPSLPGMLPPVQAAAEVSRWEDEGGKPALSPAERAARLRADRQLLREQRMTGLRQVFASAWDGCSALRAWVENNPIRATTVGVGIGYLVGRLKRR